MSKITLALATALMLAGAAHANAQGVTVKEEKPGLLKQATVSPEAATRTALARVPGGRVQSAELEQENGALIYSFDIKVAGKSGIDEVNVNAKTGAVVGGVEHEGTKEEAAEAKADKTAAGHGAVVIKEEKPGLMKQARITGAEATRKALAQVPGGHITSAELENENNALIYTFDIKVTGKAGIEEIHIDAKTGAFLKREHEKN